MGEGWTLDEGLAEASLPTERFAVLFDQALSAEIDRLEAELVDAQAVDARENRVPQAPGIADRIVELHEEAKSKERVFVFQALPAGRWSDLLADHPPVSQIDKRIGYNRDTFVPASIEACCVQPKMKPGDAERVKAKVTEAVWFGMANTVRGLNEVLRGPKSVSPIARLLASVQRSTSPAPSDNPEAFSSDE